MVSCQTFALVCQTGLEEWRIRSVFRGRIIEGVLVNSAPTQRIHVPQFLSQNPLLVEQTLELPVLLLSPRLGIPLVIFKQPILKHAWTRIANDVEVNRFSSRLLALRLPCLTLLLIWVVGVLAIGLPLVADFHLNLADSLRIELWVFPSLPLPTDQALATHKGWLRSLRVVLVSRGI